MTEPRPVYGVAPGTTPARIAHYLKMRAAAIQYLRMLEGELIEMGALRPHERACMTRAERRDVAAIRDVTEAGA